VNRFEVRPACAADVPTIHALIAELALYEKEPEAFVLSQEDLLKHGFGETPPLFEVCVADGGAEGLLGMAMVYTKFLVYTMVYTVVRVLYTMVYTSLTNFYDLLHRIRCSDH
jgi:hypothetical protein